MSKYKSFSLLLLRLAIASVFLTAGLMKFSGFPGGVMGAFQSMGFPGFLGPIVAFVEVIGSLLLILGLWTKWPSVALLVIMITALFGVHLKEGFSSNLKIVMLMATGLIVIATHGPGAWSLGKKQE